MTHRKSSRRASSGDHVSCVSGRLRTSAIRAARTLAPLTRFTLVSKAEWPQFAPGHTSNRLRPSAWQRIRPTALRGPARNHSRSAPQTLDEPRSRLLWVTFSGCPRRAITCKSAVLRVAAGQLGYLSILLAKAGRSLSPAALSGGTERGATKFPGGGRRRRDPRVAFRLIRDKSESGAHLAPRADPNRRPRPKRSTSRFSERSASSSAWRWPPRSERGLTGPQRRSPTRYGM